MSRWNLRIQFEGIDTTELVPQNTKAICFHEAPTAAEATRLLKDREKDPTFQWGVLSKSACTIEEILDVAEGRSEGRFKTGHLNQVWIAVGYNNISRDPWVSEPIWKLAKVLKTDDTVGTLERQVESLQTQQRNLIAAIVGRNPTVFTKHWLEKVKKEWKLDLDVEMIYDITMAGLDGANFDH